MNCTARLVLLLAIGLGLAPKVAHATASVNVDQSVSIAWILLGRNPVDVGFISNVLTKSSNHNGLIVAEDTQNINFALTNIGISSGNNDLNFHRQFFCEINVTDPATEAAACGMYVKAIDSNGAIIAGLGYFVHYDPHNILPQLQLPGLDFPADHLPYEIDEAFDEYDTSLLPGTTVNYTATIDTFAEVFSPVVEPNAFSLFISLLLIIYCAVYRSHGLLISYRVGQIGRASMLRDPQAEHFSRRVKSGKNMAP